MIIAGFDPGLNRTGYALVKDTTPMTVLNFGIIAPAAKQPLQKRLDRIYREAGRLLDTYRPELVLVEEVYFSKNPQATLSIGVVRGVLFAAAIQRDLTLASFSPSEVKLAVTGRGNATKEQVTYLTTRLLALPEEPAEDSADALALCVCYLNRRRLERLGLEGEAAIRLR